MIKLLSMKKQLIWLLSLIVLITVWCSSSTQNKSYVNETKTYSNNIETEYKKPAQYVTVKYRSTQVDVSDFEYLNTSKSSWIRWAWYDASNKYMIINLDWTNYHYCWFPSSIWSSFKNADSFWKYYNAYIKWKYDCRNGYVPSY